MAKKTSINLYSRVSPEAHNFLKKIAEENSLSMSSVISIACHRIIEQYKKTGKL